MNAISNQDKPKEYTKITLNVGDDNWGKVLKYVAANKSKGLKEIVETLESKYSITANIKKELKKLI